MLLEISPKNRGDLTWQCHVRLVFSMNKPHMAMGNDRDGGSYIALLIWINIEKWQVVFLSLSKNLEIIELGIKQNWWDVVSITFKKIEQPNKLVGSCFNHLKMGNPWNKIRSRWDMKSLAGMGCSPVTGGKILIDIPRFRFHKACSAKNWVLKRWKRWCKLWEVKYYESAAFISWI